METLAQYVKRIMDEKGLSSRDIQARSGKKIADSYNNKIVNGVTTNPSIDKTKALAEGLGVDEDEVFKVARCIPIKESGSRGGDPWPSNILIGAVEVGIRGRAVLIMSIESRLGSIAYNASGKQSILTEVKVEADKALKIAKELQRKKAEFIQKLNDNPTTMRDLRRSASPVIAQSATQPELYVLLTA